MILLLETPNKRVDRYTQFCVFAFSTQHLCEFSQNWAEHNVTSCPSSLSRSFCPLQPICFAPFLSLVLLSFFKPLPLLILNDSYVKAKCGFWFSHDPEIFRPVLKYEYSYVLQCYHSGLETVLCKHVQAQLTSRFLLRLSFGKKSSYNSWTTKLLRFSPVAPIHQVVLFFCSQHLFHVLYLDWKLLAALTLFESQLSGLPMVKAFLHIQKQEECNPTKN